MAMPPHYVVVGHDNHPQGFVDEPGIDTASTHSATDGGDTGWGSDDQTADTADDDDLGHGDADAGGDSWLDAGGDDLGGDDW